MILSIGHSTHSPNEFARIAEGIVDVVVDVRSHPTSRWEQWRLEEMRRWLPEKGFDVVWMPELGGWTARHCEQWAGPMAAVGVDLAAYSKGAFPKQRIGIDRPDAGDGPSWTNQGLYDYAWYTATPEFRGGLDGLLERYGHGHRPRAALLCSEALWWKCHRSMIADVLITRGVSVLHVKPRRPIKPTTSRWDDHAAKLGNRLTRYPAAVVREWGLVSER